MSERILITGGAGAIGTLLRAQLRRPGRELVLLDVVAPAPPRDGEPAEIVVASVDDLDAVLAAAQGADAIIHLGGLIDGRRWDEYAQINITGTYVVLEAARRAGVPRVVYASSNHAVGYVERPRTAGAPVPADRFPRPDSLYGVGKVASEALGSLYHDRHGLDVICARIGSCRPVPNDRRCLWSWLSYPDTVRLMEAALGVPHPGFRVVWGVSANTRGWWSLAEGRAIGYVPQDDAEDYAAAVLATDTAEPEYLGGPYAAPGFDAAGRTWNIAAGRPRRRGAVWYHCTMAATSEEMIVLLHGVPAFSALEQADLAQVVDVTVPRSFGAGEVVFREGDEGDTCYVVRSGQARAVREHSDGRSITLATFGRGEIFGELAMFDDEHRSATVEALEETEVVAILGADMRRLLRAHPDIAVKMLGALAGRLRETNERLARQSFQTVQSRVASVLADMVATARSQGAGETDVLITATQSDLAQLAGSSRESASRFLAVLERAGVITQGRGRLIVHDPGRLEGYVY